MQHQVLSVAAIIPRTHALGPGERFAVWTQGCPHACPGCVAPDFIPSHTGHPVALNTLVDQVRATVGIEGITISGGEPLFQARAVAELLRRAQTELGLSTIVYTGYSTEELGRLSARRNAVRRVLQHADVLIDGRYEHSLNDSRGLRGSSNQVVHFLTARYRDQRALFETSERRLEMHEVEDGLMFVGIPPLDTWRRLVFESDL